MKTLLHLGSLCLLFCITVYSASSQLNTDAYFKYLEEHKNMKVQDLLLEYPAGVFASGAPADLANTDFFSSIDSKFKFTEYEKSIASSNSFMVTERLSYPTYAVAFSDAYTKDLPLYISSDAILHALHRSYDNMLAHIETYSLEPELFKALIAMKSSLKSYPVSNDTLVQKARNDADIYLTVALQLISIDDYYKNSNYSTEATFSDNKVQIDKIIQLIKGESLSSYPLFGSTNRVIDFSQMKPRGHYVEQRITGYFKAMMWLGRTEIFITKPKSDVPPTDEDIKRQCMLSVILANLANNSEAKQKLATIDNLITKFVGEQDNLSLTKLTSVISKLGVSSPEQLVKDEVLKSFQEEALKQGAEQKILSQVLWADPFNKEPITPGAAFMLMGQRFIFDSYILGNLVYDKVLTRLMPKPLDVMFTLGNDAAIQILKPEIEQYDYAKNLAGLRYLTSTFPKDFWESSLYSTWLSGIRSLNPPLDRKKLPRFMQTSAWWQKSLNTQLGSWAELRHDNLLYAKQSYTGGLGCFYPKGFVEPVPALYSTISVFSERLKAALTGLTVDTQFLSKYSIGALDTMRANLDFISSTCKLLSSMAEKELKGEAFNSQEQLLIKNWIEVKEESGCVVTISYNGVYPRLLYGVYSEDMDVPNYVVADVHTQPTDLAGNIVGKVLHVGTGKVNMALIVAQDPADGCSTAYIGPVGSYFEEITDNFERLSDEEWRKIDASKLHRPALVNSYLANNLGESTGKPETLFLGGVAAKPIIPSNTINGTVTPNPTYNSAVITFELPVSVIGKQIDIKVYSVNGEYVKDLKYMPSTDNGRFTTVWDGLSAAGEKIASGVYFVHISAAESSSIFQFTINR